MLCRIAGDMQTELRPWIWLEGKAPPERCGAITSNFFGQGKFSHVLAVELGQALCPRDAPEPSAEQKAQSQAPEHSVLPDD
jgi:hypothetical protein